MRKVLLVFFPCFSLLFCLLYYLAGDIRKPTQQSPLKVVTSHTSNEKQSSLEFGKRKIKLLSYHKIEQGKYYHYQGPEKKLDFEIHFDRIKPGGEGKIILTDLNCIYFNKQKGKKIQPPQRFTIKSKQGVLIQKAKEFQILELPDPVIVTGYEKEKATVILKTKALIIDFAEKKWKTKEKVEMAHVGGLRIEGKGMQGDLVLEQLTFHSDTYFEIKSSLWQMYPAMDKDRKIYFDYLNSKSKGPLSVKHIKQDKLLTIEQKQKVLMTSDGAKLSCEQAQFTLTKRKEKKGEKWVLQKCRAKNNVVFESGKGKERNYATGNFVRIDYVPIPEKLSKSLPTLTIRGKPNLIIGNFAGFPLVEPKRKKKLAADQKKWEITRLHLSCDHYLQWKKRKIKNKRTLRDSYKLSKNVRIIETGPDGKKRELICDKARLVTDTGKDIYDSKQKMPVYFKAEGEVRLEHEKGKVSGQLLNWHRISDFESQALLSGNPMLRFEKIAMTNSTDFSAAFTEEKKEKKQEEEEEDIEIHSRSPMKFYIIEKPYGNALKGAGIAGDMIFRGKPFFTRPILHYSAKNDVKIIRYPFQSNKEKGKILCRYLTMSMVPTSKEQTAENKMAGIESLKADNPVLITKENKTSSQTLQYDGKILVMTGKAFFKGEQGSMTGNRFQYHKEQEIFQATGEPVTINSPEMKAQGSTIIYHKKEDKLELQGNPAWIRQMEKGKEKNILYAQNIKYWRNENIMNAEKDVELLFSIEDKDQQHFSSSFFGLEKKKNNKTPSKEKEERYRLQTQFLHVEIDKDQKQLKSFRAGDGVQLAKTGIDAKEQKIIGEWAQYDGQKGVLYGRPAEIHYDGNKIIGEKFRYDGKTEEIICENPRQVYLAQVGSKTNLASLSGPTQSDTNIAITCKDHIRFERQNNHLRFSRDVTLKSETSQLSCQELNVYLEKDKQEVSSMTAFRNIKFQSGEHIVWADKLHWDPKKGMVSIIGFPHVLWQSGQMNMKSPIIWFDVEKKRFTTRGRNISFEGMMPE